MSSAESFIVGKDASLEFTISTMQAKLAALGFDVEERSWLNPVDGIWSVHVRNRDCPPMFTNGKGASRLACLASALGEFFERLSTNYFWNHYYLGRAFAEGNSRSFVHYPQGAGLSRAKTVPGRRICSHPSCSRFTTHAAASTPTRWWTSIPATAIAASAPFPMCVNATTLRFIFR